MCEMPEEYYTEEAFLRRNKYLKLIKKRFPEADLSMEGPYDVEEAESMATYEARKSFEDNFKKKLMQILENCKTERAFKIQFNKWKKYLKENFDPDTLYLFS